MLSGFTAPLQAQAITGAQGLANLSSTLTDPTAVIIGSGISGISLAQRLSHSEQDSPLNVMLITGSPQDRRRLTSGCSVRWAALERLGAIFGQAPKALADALGGAEASFSTLEMSRGKRRKDGMHRPEPDHSATLEHPIAVSAHPDEIRQVLRNLLPANPRLKIIAADVSRDAKWSESGLPLTFSNGDTAKLRLPSQRSVVFNSTLNQTLLGQQLTLDEPRFWVTATQVPVAVPSRHRIFENRGTAVSTRISSRPTLTKQGGPQVFFVTPFSPNRIKGANAYIIGLMLATSGQYHKNGREGLISSVNQNLLGLARALNLELIAPQTTQGSVVLPIRRLSGRELHDRREDELPIVNTNASFSPGAEAIFLDGMLSRALGADVFASAFLAALPNMHPLEAAIQALRVADDALEPIRRANKKFADGFYISSVISELLFNYGFPRLPAHKWERITRSIATLGGTESASPQ